MRISVAIIAKNEEAMIQGCIESVLDADEIVLVDTGSEDNTKALAIKAGATRVCTDFTWCDDFAAARNHAISKCTGDWILSIDADDRLTEGGMKKIRKAIREHPEDRAFHILFMAEKGGSTHKLPYIYKNSKEVFFKGAAHNYLSVTAAHDSGATMIYGYSPSHKKDPGRTFRILYKAVMADRKKPREVFYLSREYQYKKDWISCLYWSE